MPNMWIPYCMPDGPRKTESVYNKVLPRGSIDAEMILKLKCHVENPLFGQDAGEGLHLLGYGCGTHVPRFPDMAAY